MTVLLDEIAEFRKLAQVAKRLVESGESHDSVGNASVVINYEERRDQLLAKLIEAYERDAADAERWRALLQTGYMRALGWAGFGPIFDVVKSGTADESGYRHFGMEFTSVTNAEKTHADLVTKANERSRELLTSFVDTLRERFGKGKA